MNIYYLKKFRKEAWRLICLEYSEYTNVFWIMFRGSMNDRLYDKKPYFNLQDGLKALAEKRRKIIHHSLVNERMKKAYGSQINNRKLRQL